MRNATFIIVIIIHPLSMKHIHTTNPLTRIYTTVSGCQCLNSTIIFIAPIAPPVIIAYVICKEVCSLSRTLFFIGVYYWIPVYYLTIPDLAEGAERFTILLPLMLVLNIRRWADIRWRVWWQTRFHDDALVKPWWC